MCSFENPWDYSAPRPSVHGISQVIILECVAISFSKGSSQPRNQTCIPCLAVRFFTTQPPGKSAMEYYSAIKKNKIILFAVTWMDPEIVVKREVCQTKTNIICYCLYDIYLKTVQMNLFTKQKYSHRCRKQTRISEGKGWGQE